VGSLFAALVLVVAGVVVTATPASAACPTLANGSYLGTWEQGGLNGVGQSDITVSGSTVTGVMTLITGTTVVAPGSAVNGTISCNLLAVTVGGLPLAGVISPNGQEILSGTFVGGPGSWRSGLILDQASSASGSVSIGPGVPAPTYPVTAKIDSPTGPVAMAKAVSHGGSVGPFSLFDTLVNITAPPATVAAPIRLEFGVDGSTTGGVSYAAIQVFRNGIQVLDCTGAPNTATPDPCVASRVPTAGGGATLVVLTSLASTWSLGAIPPAPSDTTPPLIVPVVSGSLGSNGWYTSDVSVGWNIVEPDSVVTSSSGCGSTVVASDTAGISLICTATSGGGTASSSVFIKRDATAPILMPSVSPNPVLLHGGAVASAAATDTMSGLAGSSCDPVDTGSVGGHTVSCSAIDGAGNSATGSANYQVTYGFVGFSAPVDNGGVLNRANAGRTIPMKWRLVDADGAPVSDLSSATLRIAPLACSLGLAVDAVEEYAVEGSGLKNLGNGYYQFNWKTPKQYVNSCRTAQLDLGEGLSHDSLFQFTR